MDCFVSGEDCHLQSGDADELGGVGEGFLSEAVNDGNYCRG